MLRAIANTPALDFDSTLFQTLIIVSFHGLLRLGDLCHPSVASSKNPAKRARRSSVRFVGNDHFSFRLPAHKADPFFEGNLVLIRRLWHDLDVVAIFKHYLRLRDALHPFASPLWLTSSGSVPDHNFFLSHLNRFNLGPSIRGQSMRAGGATALAELGASPDAIQALGRWSSNAWKIYIRKHPVLIHRLQPQVPHVPLHRP
ncbi:hypothetical protein D9611_006952 [Ephemerocybe angulata]|uniref:Uncharacterized protein n=1 Tax=Ephemerocybe angulata TaxID=980116 RepID=A0A8H5AZU9_9AGAR|nr:hypothetical protein D9611_006952 [Tulosesus angulatus]